jgi:hypothetical protein
MARPKKDPTTIEQPAADDAAISESLANVDALAADSERRELAVLTIGERYDVDLPKYDRALFVERAKFHLAHSAQSMLQAGVILLAMKQAEGHGNFVRVVEDQLGMAYATASRMMRAAVKFGGEAGKKMLSNMASSPHLSKAKLFELMTLDDDTFNDLADGELDELKLDDVACMSVTELRRAIRELKGDAQAKDDAIAALSTEVQKGKKRKKAEDPDAQALADFEAAINDFGGESAKLIRKDMVDAYDAVLSTEWVASVIKPNVDRAKLFMTQRLQMIVATARDAAQSMSIRARDIGVADEDDMPPDFH